MVNVQKRDCRVEGHGCPYLGQRPACPPGAGPLETLENSRGHVLSRELLPESCRWFPGEVGLLGDP